MCAWMYCHPYTRGWQSGWRDSAFWSSLLTVTALDAAKSLNAEIWALLGTTVQSLLISSAPRLTLNHSVSYEIWMSLFNSFLRYLKTFFYDSSDTNPPKQINTILNKCMGPVHTVLMIRPDNHARNMHCDSHWINLSFSKYFFLK